MNRSEPPIMTIKMIEKPEPPASNECCGSGSCCPCVWDYYREQLAIWQQQQIHVLVKPVTETESK
ncbi:MAG: hypothetical protein KJ930_10135 [Gammaproteobacteria bacterium]|nr:hypothetical protein [Gammaproteobacteria bacterium]